MNNTSSNLPLGLSIIPAALGHSLSIIKYFAIPLAGFIPVAGHYTKQLYLDHFGIRYADFASYSDLTMDAIGGFSSLVVILFLTVLIACLIGACFVALNWLVRRPLKIIAWALLYVALLIIKALSITIALAVSAINSLINYKPAIGSLILKLQGIANGALEQLTDFCKRSLNDSLEKQVHIEFQTVNLTVAVSMFALFTVFVIAVLFDRYNSGQVAYNLVVENDSPLESQSKTNASVQATPTTWQSLVDKYPQDTFRHLNLENRFVSSLMLNRFKPSLVEYVHTEGSLRNHLNALCATNVDRELNQNVFFLTQNSSYAFFAIQGPPQENSRSARNVSTLTLKTGSLGEFSLVDASQLKAHPKLSTKCPTKPISRDVKKSPETSIAQTLKETNSIIDKALERLDVGAPLQVAVTEVPSDEFSVKLDTGGEKINIAVAASAPETIALEEKFDKLIKAEVDSVKVELCLRAWESEGIPLLKLLSKRHKFDCGRLLDGAWKGDKSTGLETSKSNQIQ